MRQRNRPTYFKVQEPKIGWGYHLNWANRSCVWILRSFDIVDGTCQLETPKTKKKLCAKIDDLRHTKKNEIKLGLK